jgi:hypothetical protein
MASKQYIDRAVTNRELESLVLLATVEERDFFDRNPHLSLSYRDRLLAVAFCQGAALQYLGRGSGVGDFDVHFFYAQNPQKPRLSRAIKRKKADVGSFEKIAVDFIRTVVPTSTRHDTQPLELLRSFLINPPTDNARHLAQKAVIGFLPRYLFGKVIWPLG